MKAPMKRASKNTPAKGGFRGHPVMPAAKYRTSMKGKAHVSR